MCLLKTYIFFLSERALGAIFFATGGFETWDDYLLFAEAQDVGDVTLNSAKEFSTLVDAIYNETIRTIDEFVGGLSDFFEHL